MNPIMKHIEAERTGKIFASTLPIRMEADERVVRTVNYDYLEEYEIRFSVSAKVRMHPHSGCSDEMERAKIDCSLLISEAVYGPYKSGLIRALHEIKYGDKEEAYKAINSVLCDMLARIPI